MFKLYPHQFPFTIFSGTKDRLYETVCIGKLYLNSAKWQYISDHAKDLLRQMLRVDPQERINVDEALKHPWISDRDRYASKVSTYILGWVNIRGKSLLESWVTTFLPD